VCAAAYFSFVTQNVPSLFNESKLLAYTIYNTLVLGLLVIAVDQLVGDEAPAARLTVRGFGMIIAFSAIILGLWYPKYIAIRYPNKASGSKKHSSFSSTTSKQKAGGGASQSGMEMKESELKDTVRMLTADVEALKAEISALRRVLPADVNVPAAELTAAGINIVPAGEATGRKQTEGQEV